MRIRTGVFIVVGSHESVGRTPETSRSWSAPSPPSADSRRERHGAVPADTRPRRRASGGAPAREPRETHRGRLRRRSRRRRFLVLVRGGSERGHPPRGGLPWFKLSSWRDLLDALDLETFDPASPLLRTNVAWILNGGWRGQRVHRLAVVIIDAFETPFGDLKVVFSPTPPAPSDAPCTGTPSHPTHSPYERAARSYSRTSPCSPSPSTPNSTSASLTTNSCARLNPPKRASTLPTKPPRENESDAKPPKQPPERPPERLDETRACDSQALPAPSRSPSRRAREPGSSSRGGHSRGARGGGGGGAREGGNRRANGRDGGARARGRRAAKTAAETRARAASASSPTTRPNNPNRRSRARSLSRRRHC